MSKENKDTPSVRHLSISSERVEQFKEEAFRILKRAISRQIVNQVNFGSLLTRPDIEFVKFGQNSIIDRIWFVDGAFNKTVWSHQGLGATYAEGIAEAETNYVVEKITHSCPKENTITSDITISYETIFNAIGKLSENFLQPNIILTDIANEFELWKFPHLRLANGELGIPRIHFGFQEDIPIIFSRVVTLGTTFVIDKESFGRLVIKTDLNVEVSEINMPNVREKVLRDLPTLTSDELDEKIRLLIYEIVGMKITNPQASCVIR